MTVVHVLVRETRYKSVHSTNHQHMGVTVASTTDGPPEHMPRLNVWLPHTDSEYRGMEVRYSLHKSRLA